MPCVSPLSWSCMPAAQCDGRPIPLPSLQGIAVLNIPSYAGGTNFWGGTKEDDVRTRVLGGMGLSSGRVVGTRGVTPSTSVSPLGPRRSLGMHSGRCVSGAEGWIVASALSCQWAGVESRADGDPTHGRRG